MDIKFDIPFIEHCDHFLQNLQAYEIQLWTTYAKKSLGSTVKFQF